MKLTLRKNLTPLKTEACSKIDREAENVRALFVTMGSGQAMVYQQKLSEAELYLSDQNVSEALISHVVSEANLNGISIYDQAAIIVTMAEQWKTISVLIEELRLSSKKAVQTASNPAEIEAAMAVDWSPITSLVEST